MSVAKRKKPIVWDVPPPWCIVGAKVDYHAVIGREVTLPNCTITEAPWRMASRWVTMLDKKAGCVALEALSPAKGA